MNKPDSIIIVGSGKAAFLHLDAYTRIWQGDNLPEISIVMGDRKDEGIEKIAQVHNSRVMIKSIEQLRESSDKKLLVDVCTPTSTHRKVIDQMYNLGYRHFLVEKPLVITGDDLMWIASLRINLTVMQNYLFSSATQRTLEIIRSGQFCPQKMFSFFCKNRSDDSFQGRGFNGVHPPHVLTVEFPHQIYLASAFLGSADVVFSAAQSMKVGTVEFSNHGAGHLSLEHIGTESGGRLSQSFHYSCLYSKECIRKLVLMDAGGQTLSLDFPITSGILTSHINFTHFKKDNFHHESFDNDDMMKKSLEYYCSSFFAEDNPLKIAGGVENAATVIRAMAQSENSQMMDVCHHCREVTSRFAINLPCNNLIRHSNEISQS